MVDKYLKPHSSILEAIASKSPNATPFSAIPLFLKKYIVQAENAREISTILQKISEKEIDHLEKKLSVHNLNISFDVYKNIIEIESGMDSKGRHIKNILIGIAKQMLVDEMGSSVKDILHKIEVAYAPQVIDNSYYTNEHTDKPLTEEEKEIVDKEKHVRIMVNAIIMGAGHRVFDQLSPDSKYIKAIDKIDPSLYQSYYNLVYQTLKGMREIPPHGTIGGHNTGSVELDTIGNETKILIKADIFPVLLHEMSKGVLEYISNIRYNSMQPDLVSSILSVDSRADEHRMMLIGPQIYKQLLFLLKESIEQYKDQYGLLEGKKGSDYIIILLTKILQLPADDFLHLTEKILSGEADGNTSIEMIHGLIQDIHTQYNDFLQSASSTQKIENTREQVIVQLTKQLSLGEEVQQFLNNTIDTIKEYCITYGFDIDRKKIGKKLASFYHIYSQKYSHEEFLTLMEDCIKGFELSRIELAGLSLLRSDQKKHSFKTKDATTLKTKNIQPRFTYQQLEAAKSNISESTAKKIKNEVQELLNNGTIEQWIHDHDSMNQKQSELTESLLTLDDVLPECVVERENNRGLYRLINGEQLKRESQMMGGHCVHDYVGNVKAGVNIIYSLRFGTKSRRTIGYSTISKSIFQVKGYTGGVKNSILDKNEDDFPHVMRAIAELCDMYKVNEIRDIKKEYFNGFVFEEGGLIVPTKNFIERDNNIFQYYNIVYQENAYFVTDNWNAEKDRLETLITFDVPKEKLALYYRGDLYYPNHVLITLKNQSPFSNRILLLDKTPEGAYEVIYSIPGNEAEALLDGMHPHEVLVKTSDAIILLRKDGNTFNKVFECDYLFENPSAFLFGFEFEFGKQVQNPDDYILIDNKRKFGVLKRNEKGQYSLVMPCVSKTVIRFHGATITEITGSDNKKGIVEYDSTGVRKFVVPCKYSAFTTVNHERLYDQFLVSHKYLVGTNDDSTSDIYSVSGETGKLTYDLLLENVVNFGEPKSHPAIADNFLVVNFQNSETQINSHIYVIDKSGGLNAITIHNDYTIRNRCGLSNGDFVVNTIGRGDVVLRKNSQGYLQEVFVSGGTFDMLKTAMNVGKLNWINIGGKYRICSYQNGNYTLGDMEFNDMPQLGERGLPSHMARANMDDKYGIIACSPEGKIETVVKFKFNHPVNFVHNKAIITVEDSNFSFLLEYKGSNIIEEMILPVSNVVHCSEDIIVQQNAGDVSIYKIQENNSFIPLSVDLPADRVKDQGMYGLDYGQFWHSDKGKNGIVQIEGSGFNTLLPAEYDAIGEFGLDGFPRQYARVMKDGKSERRNSAVSNSKMGVIEKGVNGYYHEVIPTNYFVINYIEEDTIPGYDWGFVAISKDNHGNELYSYYFPDENGTLQAIWKDLKEEITQSHRGFGLYEMPTRDGYIGLFDLDTNGKLVSVLPDGFGLSNDIKADESEYEFVIRNMQSGEYFIVKFNDDKILEYISPGFYAGELTILDYKEIKYLTLYSDTNSSGEVLLRKNEETGKYFNILPPNSTSIHKAGMIHYVQSREHNIYLISKIDENDNIKIELFKNTAEGLNYIPLIRQCELVKDILGLQEKVLLVYDMSYNENHNPYYLRWDTSEGQFFSDYIAKNTYKIVYGNDNFQVVKNPSEMSIDKLMQLSPEFKKYVDNKDRLLDDVPF